MTTDANPEHFSIAVTLPLFGGDGSIEGGAISLAAAPTLIGPGSIGIEREIVSFSSCSTREIGRIHGIQRREVWSEITLPPFSDTQYVGQFYVAPTPPWVGTSYVPLFSVSSMLPGGGFGTSVASQTIRPPEPGITGNRGVKVDFTTSPPSAPRADRLPKVQIHRGKPITIEGTTSPALDRQVLRLAFYGPEDAKLRPIGQIRTDSLGHFRWPDRKKLRKKLERLKAKGFSKKQRRKKVKKGWTPKRLGDYELRAYYDSQQAGLAADFTCPRGFELVP